MAVVLAVKYSEDVFFDNKYYARVGGVSLHELNKLEKKAVLLMNYNLHVDSQVYAQYSREIHESLASKRLEGISQGLRKVHSSDRIKLVSPMNVLQ